jgi:hypothetical protein
MWTKRNYLTCVGLMLCLLQAFPALFRFRLYRREVAGLFNARGG